LPPPPRQRLLETPDKPEVILDTQYTIPDTSEEVRLFIERHKNNKFSIGVYTTNFDSPSTKNFLDLDTSTRALFCNRNLFGSQRTERVFIRGQGWSEREQVTKKTIEMPGEFPLVLPTQSIPLELLLSSVEEWDHPLQELDLEEVLEARSIDLEKELGKHPRGFEYVYFTPPITSLPQLRNKPEITAIETEIDINPGNTDPTKPLWIYLAPRLGNGIPEKPEKDKSPSPEKQTLVYLDFQREKIDPNEGIITRISLEPEKDDVQELSEGLLLPPSSPFKPVGEVNGERWERDRGAFFTNAWPFSGKLNPLLINPQTYPHHTFIPSYDILLKDGSAEIFAAGGYAYVGAWPEESFLKINSIKFKSKEALQNFRRKLNAHIEENGWLGKWLGKEEENPREIRLDSRMDGALGLGILRDSEYIQVSATINNPEATLAYLQTLEELRGTNGRFVYNHAVNRNPIPEQDKQVRTEIERTRQKILQTPFVFSRTDGRHHIEEDLWIFENGSPRKLIDIPGDQEEPYINSREFTESPFTPEFIPEEEGRIIFYSDHESKSGRNGKYSISTEGTDLRTLIPPEDFTPNKEETYWYQRRTDKDKPAMEKEVSSGPAIMRSLE
jgi:hypothetical protein